MMELGARRGYSAIGAGAAAPAGAPAPRPARPARPWRRAVVGAFAAACSAAALSASRLRRRGARAAAPRVPATLAVDAGGHFDADGRFVLRDFDARKPFASFLPGIGGEWGVPMWAFYVNRGQGVAAFGVENKDGPLLEFEPANKAYMDAPFRGFRTLLRLKRGGAKAAVAQPFFAPPSKRRERTMLIGMNELELVERDAESGVETRVLYYTVAGEDFPALVRRVTLTNVGEGSVDVEAADGLAKLEPFGVNAGMLGTMGRTLEGWMRVYNCGRAEDSTKPSAAACPLPYFKLSASTADSAQVQMITEGHFAFGYVEDAAEELLPVVVDPDVIFGDDTTLRDPAGFAARGAAVADAAEVKVSKTPCAFAVAATTLAAGASTTLVTVWGRARTVPQLVDDIAPTVLKDRFASKKYVEAVALTERLTAAVASETANPLFDAFSRQMLLDNLLRGGFPEFLGAGGGAEKRVYHTFSRIHGDLERDYNNFQIDATYFSQGSGNYRDVNQNRRVDVLLFPGVRDFNLRQFLTLKQADGYNPLTVATAFFSLAPEGARDDAAARAKAAPVAEALAGDAASRKKLAALLARPFRPGDLFEQARAAKIKFAKDRTAVLDAAAGAARQVFAANYTHEGFWADHWTYDLDQILSFEAVYPDDVERALWDAEKIPFYMSAGTVQPRDFKYVEVDGLGIRQYNSVYDDPEKLGQLADRDAQPDGAFELAAPTGDDDASSVVYTVAPVAKVLLLFTTKFTLLDPSGLGVEMDANKPGWNDAMNGLPGLLGSGMPETCEAWRIGDWLSSTISRVKRPVVVPVELGDFIANTTEALKDASLTDFEYWERVASDREAYRARVRLFFSGDEVSLDAATLLDFLGRATKKLEKGIEKSLAYTDGVIMPTYFQHVVTSYEYTGLKNFVGQPFVRATAFEAKVFPLFLEGPVRQLKTVPRADGVQLKKIHDAVLASPLYDEPIGQYKICESLEGQPFEMGRMMAFTPGWLENESIWLHMSFKYYLELLRAGLYEDFWTAMATGAPYNMDVETYGRSPLECGSFIVSSAYPDEELWGTSYLARLSGSTAEFLSIWLLVFAGPAPFTLGDGGGLELALRPAVPAKLFKDDGTVTFTFLGGVEVTYVNPSRADSWTLEVVKMELLASKDDDGAKTTVDGPALTGAAAEAVRNLQYEAVRVYLE